VLKDDVQLISVDDHVIEHPRVWTDRVPAALRDRAPHILDEGGTATWVYDGHSFTSVGLNAVAGKPWELRNIDPANYADMRPGCYDAHSRLADMDVDGVHAQLCFPDFPGFAGRRFIKAPDKDLALVCLAAWNDYILDEWCGAAPDRFIPMMLLPYWDIDLCVRELERTLAKGAKAITFPELPDALGLPSLFTDDWAPLFSLVEEAAIPLCMHFGTGGSIDARPGRPMAAQWTLGGQRSMTAAVDLLMSPVLHRWPGIKVLLSEGGIGWMPYILERADYVWERHRFYEEVSPVKPSELFVGHIYGCFISDRAGLRDRHAIGVDQIMWEGDYPHADSNFPHSRKVLGEELASLPDAEAALIAEGNARRVFDFPRR